jgi:hypothetical protein
VANLYLCLVVKIPVCSPTELCQEVFFTEDVIEKSPKPGAFNVIYRAKNRAIVSQQTSGEL